MKKEHYLKQQLEGPNDIRVHPKHISWKSQPYCYSYCLLHTDHVVIVIIMRAIKRHQITIINSMLLIQIQNKFHLYLFNLVTFKSLLMHQQNYALSGKNDGNFFTLKMVVTISRLNQSWGHSKIINYCFALVRSFLCNPFKFEFYNSAFKQQYVFDNIYKTVNHKKQDSQYMYFFRITQLS